MRYINRIEEPSMLAKRNNNNNNNDYYYYTVTNNIINVIKLNSYVKNNE